MRTQAGLPAAGMISELAGHTYFQILFDPWNTPAYRHYIAFDGANTVYWTRYPDTPRVVLCGGRPYMKIRVIDGNGGTNIHNYPGDWALVPTGEVEVVYGSYHPTTQVDFSSKPGGGGVVKSVNLRRP